MFADRRPMRRRPGFHSRRAAGGQPPPSVAARSKAYARSTSGRTKRRSWYKMPPCCQRSVGPCVFSCLAALAFGYLCGSIPFGVLLTRLAGTQDIRSIGSGNIGATNVLRTGRKGLAAATLLGDALKGTLAVLIVAHAFGPRAGARDRLRRLSRPPLSGLAALQGRQGGRDLYRPPARARLAGRARLLPDLARGRGDHPLLVARGSGRQRADAADPAGSSAAATAALLFVLLTVLLWITAPREHRAAARRHRKQDRPVSKSIGKTKVGRGRPAWRLSISLSGIEDVAPLCSVRRIARCSHGTGGARA